jgi:hypothetical protein
MKRSNIIKGLKIVGLGIAVWGLSLFWPEVNRLLTESALIKVLLGLGVVTLVYVLSQYLGRPHDHHGRGQDHSSNPTSNNLSPIAIPVKEG